MRCLGIKGGRLQLPLGIERDELFDALFGSLQIAVAQPQHAHPCFIVLQRFVERQLSPFDLRDGLLQGFECLFKAELLF